MTAKTRPASLTRKTRHGWVSLTQSGGGWSAGSRFGLHCTALRAFLAFRTWHKAAELTAKSPGLAAFVILPPALALALAGNWQEWTRYMDHQFSASW